METYTGVLIVTDSSIVCNQSTTVDLDGSHVSIARKGTECVGIILHTHCSAFTN